MKTITSALFVMIISGLVFISCSKKNEETLNQNNNIITDTCGGSNMKYTANIQPILQANCYGCHGNGQASGGIALDSYEKVKIVAENGRLVGSISHASGFTPMPKGGAKLSDCNINKIKAWVSSGTPN